MANNMKVWLKHAPSLWGKKSARRGEVSKTNLRRRGREIAQSWRSGWFCSGLRGKLEVGLVSDERSQREYGPEHPLWMKLEAIVEELREGVEVGVLPGHGEDVDLIAYPLHAKADLVG